MWIVSLTLPPIHDCFSCRNWRGHVHDCIDPHFGIPNSLLGDSPHHSCKIYTKVLCLNLYDGRLNADWTFSLNARQRCREAYVIRTALLSYRNMQLSVSPPSKNLNQSLWNFVHLIMSLISPNTPKLVEICRLWAAPKMGKIYSDVTLNNYMNTLLIFLGSHTDQTAELVSSFTYNGSIEAVWPKEGPLWGIAI